MRCGELAALRARYDAARKERPPEALPASIANAVRILHGCARDLALTDDQLTSRGVEDQAAFRRATRAYRAAWLGELRWLRRQMA
jgi:hypothetical protein